MGYSLEVVTNSYEVLEFPKRPYFQFDDITPPNTHAGQRRNAEIVGRLQTDTATVFSPRPLYDGKKIMFCLRDIPSGSYPVCMRRSDGPRAETHRVIVQRVSVLNPEDVKQLTRRRHPKDSADQGLAALTLLQLVIRQAPNMRHGFPAHARRFLIETGAKDFLCGLSAWRGYFQSVRPAMDRLLINVDVSNAVVYTPGPLLDTMMKFFDLRDLRDLQTIKDHQFIRLRHFLKRVLIIVKAGRNTRPKPIADLVRAAGLQEFDKDGTRMTVQQHYKEKYGKILKYPQLIGVRIGSSAIIPAELCEVARGQVYRKQLTPEVQQQFLRFSTQKPAERLATIERAVSDGLFNYTDSDYMRDAGMVIGQKPITVPGQIMTPPQIMYRDRNGPVPVRNSSGAWNVVQRILWQPATLKHWAVVIYDNVHSEREEREVRQFISALVRNMQNLGMTVCDTQPPWYTGNPGSPEDVLEQLRQTSIRQHLPAPEILLVLLPTNAAECRRAVKFWGDSTRKIPTQCIRRGRWDKPNGRDQYCNNLALKINARLGGVNSVIRSPISSPIIQSSMIVGADVSHPGPGVTDRPSFAGLVASVDSEAVYTTSCSSVQNPRVEIIQDLEQMMVDSLNCWRAWHWNNDRNNLIPTNIIFYRDGVSEGEFQTVIRNEIPKIKSAFAKVGLDKNRYPKLLFMIVGKRHHVRFFPKSERDADRTGNCLSGLLVDSERFTNPNHDDFYLQSQSGLLGTSRPAHYVVLENETSLDKQTIEHLTFHLCHLYPVATRSVSIPAPVYDADKVCRRLEMQCEIAPSLSDSGSYTSGSDVSFDISEWKEKYKFIPSKLNNRKGYH